MVETLTVAVKKATPEYLEPALRRTLGMRAYLSGITTVGKQRLVQAGAVRVEVIDDDLTQDRSVTFTKIPDVVSLELERHGGEYVLRVPQDSSEEILEQRYRGLLHRHESEVLRHSYRRLVQISEIDLAMRPIAEILIRANEYGEYIPGTSRSHGGRLRGARAARYAELLADLQFVERRGAGYAPGPRLSADIEADTPPQELYEEFLGRVLQASHDYLTDVLHLTMIKPFLRIENSYYWPAHLSNSKLRVQRRRLAGMYAEYYDHAPVKFETHLQSLVRWDALVAEDGMVTGADEILDPLLRTAIQPQAS